MARRVRHQIRPTPSPPRSGGEGRGEVAPILETFKTPLPVARKTKRSGAMSLSRRGFARPGCARGFAAGRQCPKQQPLGTGLGSHPPSVKISTCGMATGVELVFMVNSRRKLMPGRHKVEVHPKHTDEKTGCEVHHKHSHVQRQSLDPGINTQEMAQAKLRANYFAMALAGQ